MDTMLSCIYIQPVLYYTHIKFLLLFCVYIYIVRVLVIDNITADFSVICILSPDKFHVSSILSRFFFVLLFSHLKKENIIPTCDDSQPLLYENVEYHTYFGKSQMCEELKLVTL